MRIMLPLAALLASKAAVAESPFRVRVIPNAIESEDTPMKIVATGPPGTSAWLYVLQDCDGDRRPDPESKGACESPLLTWQKQFEDQEELNDQLDFKEHPKLPRGKRLWISICASATAQKDCSEALFMIGDDSCGLYKTIWHAFASGRCDPRLLDRALVRGGTFAVQASPFEVRLVEPVESPAPAPVPGTMGATGVAWLGQSRLIVTFGKLATSKRAPGVYLLDERGGVKKQVWKADKAETPNAPLGLPDGRVAFVITRAIAGKPTSVSLAIWDKKNVQKIALGRPVRALLAQEANGARFIGSTADDSGSSFVLIDGRSGRVTDIGSSDVLSHWLQRSPASDLVAIDYEDVATDGGWDIALVDGQGRGVAELSAGPGASWLPVWRPDGKRVAFLAELNQ